MIILLDKHHCMSQLYDVGLNACFNFHTTEAFMRYLWNSRGVH